MPTIHNTNSSSSSLPPKPPKGAGAGPAGGVSSNTHKIVSSHRPTSPKPPLSSSSSTPPLSPSSLTSSSSHNNNNNNNMTTTMLSKSNLLSSTNGGATSSNSAMTGSSNNNNNTNNTTAGGLSTPPILQGRNISADTTSTVCSRDDFRLHIEKRRKSLLQHEHAFLDNLCVHGNDIEVQLAFDRLTDDSIFFEYDSPAASTMTERNSCFNEEEEDKDDDNLGASGTTSTSTDHLINALPKEDGEPSTVTLDTNPTAAVTEGKGADDPSKMAALERPSMAGRRSSSIGSLRRVEALEARKQNNELHGHMWKAHATGLALTQNASRQSLNMRRESCNSFLAGSGGNKMLRTPRRGSTTCSSLNGKAGGGAIFRRESLEGGGATSSTNSAMLRKSQAGAAGAALGLPPRRLHQRSRSMSLQALPRIPGISLFQDSPANMSESTVRSNTSRKSVTFNVDPSQSQPTRATGKSTVRRSNSDVIPPHIRLDGEDATTAKTPPLPVPAGSGSNAPRELPLQSRAQLPSLVDRLESNASSVMSFPAIPLAQPIRSESVGSALDVPSIQRGTVLRSDSVASSIPSLHHGHALHTSGDDESPTAATSSSSIPSLHHAHSLGRVESSGSIPSLHHGHHVHGDDSVATSYAASIPSLHHAHPLRSESIGSIPSLHHAHQLLTDSQEGGIYAANYLRLDKGVGTPADIAVLQDAKANWLTQYYGTSDDIAASWMAGSNSEITTTDIIPLNVTIPSTTTAITSATTQSTAGEPDDDDDDEDGDDDDEDDDQQVHRHKPVLMRLASRSGCYEGEGVEVTELELPPQVPHRHHEEFFLYPSDANHPMDGSSSAAAGNDARNVFRNMKSLGDVSVRTVSSYDDVGESSDMGYGRRHDDIFRNIQRSLSDQDMSNLFLGSSASLLLGRDGMPMRNKIGLDIYDDLNGEFDSSSWDMEDDGDGHYDTWNVLKDEYANGYGGGGTLDFRILGTSGDDEAAHPHVLSPPLMETLQAFLPFSKTGENFFLKYSLVRDGADLHTFLKRSRGARYTILAMETVDGEVFGSFTAQPWRKNWNYFGTGESFLWKMRRNRLFKCHSIIEQAQMESEVDMFPYTGENKYIQLCTHDRIAVGGGSPDDQAAEKKDEMGDVAVPTSFGGENPATNFKAHEYGFGLSIENDMLSGCTRPCVTFASPSLSEKHSDGSRFEIVNLELWTLTPCMTIEDAEKLELASLFLERESV